MLLNHIHVYSTHSHQITDDDSHEFDLFLLEQKQREQENFLGTQSTKLITQLQGLSGAASSVAMKIEKKPIRIQGKKFRRISRELDNFFDAVRRIEEEF